MNKSTYNHRLQRLKNKIDGLPRVRWDVDERDDVTGIRAISIVDKPAIESDFVAFSSQTGRQRYQRAKRRMAEIKGGA